MAIDFPNSPTLNQIYTVGSRSWIWDGSTWNIYANVPNRYIQDAPPSSPQSGDQWFESDTGRLFVYYDSVWVEIGNATDIAGALQPGQVTALSAVTSLTTDDVFPVVDNPSSATAANKITYGNLVTAMSASLAPGLVLITSGITTNSGNTVSNGVVTVGSAVSTVEVNGAFSSTYDNYRIVIATNSASTDEAFLMTLGSSGGSYYYANLQMNFTIAYGEIKGANTSSWRLGSSDATNGAYAIVDIIRPFEAKPTSASWSNMYADTNGTAWQGGGFHNLSTSYTSFTIKPGSGTITGGTIRVYGYRNS